MIQPLTLNEFKLLAKNAKRVAVFQELPVGKLTPFSIYNLLNQHYKADGVMLEDLYPRQGARYSMICFEPLASLTINNNDKRDPLTAIRSMQTAVKFATRADVAELITSAMGFITYDAVRYFEEIADQHTVDPTLPSLLFNFYALSITLLYEKQTILISIIVEVGEQPVQRYKQAQQQLSIIKQLLLNASSPLISFTPRALLVDYRPVAVTVDTNDADFMRIIEKAKNYIIGGDAFQIVISRRFQCRYTVNPLAIYKTLCAISPAPFMFYFPTGFGVMIGASPERLVKVHNKKVTVNTIAGTRKRTGQRTAAADEAIAADLLSDPKEVAEHMMLVDLARNDVGAVSCPGSVKINELLQVKHYSHISHITSSVTGQLQEKYDALDAFVAAFPAGTLSGAPKIRAMQIIDELESSRRGLYGGAICRFDSIGNLESCIAIRMAQLQNGIATVRTGAGIVYDSHPANEAEETRQKARAMLDAIAQAHGI